MDDSPLTTTTAQLASMTLLERLTIDKADTQKTKVIRLAQRVANSELCQLNTRVEEKEEEYNTALHATGENYSASAIVVLGQELNDLIDFYSLVESRVKKDFKGLPGVTHTKVKVG